MTIYPDMLKTMLSDWVKAKAIEVKAVDERRAIEDELIKLYHIDQQKEGTTNFEHEGIKIKIVSKLARKVDSDKLQEIAAELGMTDKLSMLFRWKAEINSAVWKTETDAVRNALSGAITTSAGRPTFTITKE